MKPILPDTVVSTASSWSKRRRSIIFSVLSLLGGSLFGQSTNISVGSTTIQPSVKRFGINLGTLTFYDSGQMTQNLVWLNPGFEGQVWNSTIRCMSGTTTSCVDEDQWAAWPAGFWNNATFEVFYGAAAGRTGTVTYSTAIGSGQGVTLNFASPGVAPATGDYLIVRKKVPGGSAEGWWPATAGAGTIGDNLTDLPPGTLGLQTTVLTAPTAADSAAISGNFDSVAGKTFLQLNGTYQLQFKAKGIGGSNQIGVKVARIGVSTYLNQPVALGNSWNTYTLNFSAAEGGSAIGIAGVTFSTVGADSFELDDVTLVKTNGDPTNTTVFRDPVVTALRTLNPGLLRYWGGQLGETLDNLLTPQFGRQRAGFSAWQTESDGLDIGLHEFLALSQTVGAEPWFVVPTAFSTTDAANLIEYLGGASSTPYGAKRAALGQVIPWTQVFSKIHLEFANEAWNPTFKGGDIEYAVPYGQRAQTIFATMRANGSFVPAAFDLVLGGQAGWPGHNTDIQNSCNNNDSFAVAPYTMNTVDSFSDNESLFGSTFAEPEAYMSSTGTAEGMTPGLVYQNYNVIQGSSHPVPLSFYEVNLSTVNGAITQQALNTYTSSLGAGLMVADTMLLSLRQFGVVNQEFFALPQYQFQRPDGSEAFLWGSVVDMGVTDRKRPQFLALQLANQALSTGAAMLQTVHSGADPTWNQALVNTVQFNGAHYLHSFAFANGVNRSTVVFNLSRSASLPVTFSGANAPSGNVQMQQLTSANLTDTNEDSNVVMINPSVLSNFNGTSGLSLPPYSMTLLTWTTNSVVAPAPVISAVTASGMTGTSATITWTTDQPSSSQVKYGTTTTLGSSTGVNTTLVTNHSVALSGLTPGATYSYAVISANSAQSSSTSGTSTFTTTTAPAPVISNVAATTIGATSASITWTTDQPTSSLVNYGVTTSYGSSSSLNSTMVTSHSVALTGLTAATSYNLSVVSANAAGSSASSANSSFSTLPLNLSSSAVYSGLDATTQGAWTSKYGADGYFIANGVTQAPTYASVSLTGDSLWTWQNNTTDPRALYTSSGMGIASTYYAASSFTINVNLTDGNTHQIALYLLDWDTTSRQESISILDAATHTVESTQTFSSFQNGQYASWNVKGNVIIQVTMTGGRNAVVAGIFFGSAQSTSPAPPPPPPTGSAAAVYNGLDTATQGTWTPNYGADGYIIANDATKTPAYASVNMIGQGAWTWTSSTSDPRALQISSGSSSRTASTYYGSPNFTIDVNLTDGNTHRVALYLLDWDSTSRTETISILDATTQAVLSTQKYSSFQNGQYASWNVKGNVIIQVTATGGINAVVAGIFFGGSVAAVAPPSSTAKYNAVDTSTQGTWAGNYGADGYLIANDLNNAPAYATVSLAGQSEWTWQNPTSNVRALQLSSGSSGRIASTYYSATNFTISVNLTDGNSHRVALYLLDWDTTARVESISILDAASHAVLNTQTYSSFQNGQYVSWNVTGNVLIQLTVTAGMNAVMAGIFFDPAAPAAVASNGRDQVNATLLPLSSSDGRSLLE